MLPACRPNFAKVGRTTKTGVSRPALRHAIKAQGSQKYSSSLPLTSALEEGFGGPGNAPAALPPGTDPVSSVQEDGWASKPVWAGAENLAATGSDPRSVQLVASRYTDYATTAIF